MDELMKKAMQQVEATKKTGSSVPWTPDQPHPQPYYTFNGSTWEPHQLNSSTGSDVGGGGFSRLALFSWNIDFIIPYADERMRVALAHLETLLLPVLSSSSSSSSSSAVVVFLQECVATDLAIIAETAWVRDRFHVSDLSSEAWASGHYGTAVLVDRRLPVAGLFRVHYAQTRMERDAFFVDVLMDSSSSSSSSGDSNIKEKGKKSKQLIRLCNTHLESLAMDPPLRPAQVRLFASYMKKDASDTTTTTTTTSSSSTADKEEDKKEPPQPLPQPHGAVAAGDFNAIQDFDRALHADNGLRDAFLELGGREDTEEAYTWGQQAATGLRKLYGCSRMDKVFFCGGLKLLRFERFGADVQLEGKEEYAEMFEMFDFEKPWITDHLGVVAEFDVVD